MIKYKQNYNLLIVIFLLSLLPLFWFDSDVIIAGGDYFAPIYPSSIINNYFNPLYIWNDTINTGGLSELKVTKFFPYLSFWAILEKIGFDIDTMQYLWYSFLLISIFSSMYYLTTVIFPKMSTNAKIIVGLFYLFHPYISLWTSFFSDTRIVAYAVIPLFVGLFIQAINNKNKLYYISLFLLSNSLLFSVASNPPTWVIPWLMIVVFIIYSLIIQKNKFEIIKYTFIIITLAILINAWWIYSLFLSIASSANTLGSEVNSLSYFISHSGESSILNIFAGLGKWSFSKGVMYLGDFFPYYPEYHTYETISFWILLILILITTIFSTFDRKNIKNLILPLFFILFFIFLAKGNQFPFPTINQYLYQNFPFGWLFREPISYLLPGVIIGFGLLIGVSIDYIAKTFKYKNLLISIILFAILVRGFGLITGDIFPNARGGIYSSKVNIPEFITSINKEFKDKIVSRVLILPQLTSTYSYWKWEYMGVDRTYYFINKPYILSTKGDKKNYIDNNKVDTIITSLYKSIEDKNYEQTKGLIQSLNIQTIVYRNDFQYTHDNQLRNKKLWAISPKQFTEFVDNNSDWIKHDKDYGQWNIYVVNKYVFKEKISIRGIK